MCSITFLVYNDNEADNLNYVAIEVLIDFDLSI